MLCLSELLSEKQLRTVKKLLDDDFAELGAGETGGVALVNVDVHASAATGSSPRRKRGEMQSLSASSQKKKSCL